MVLKVLFQISCNYLLAQNAIRWQRWMIMTGSYDAMRCTTDVIVHVTCNLI